MVESLPGLCLAAPVPFLLGSGGAQDPDYWKTTALIPVIAIDLRDLVSRRDGLTVDLGYILQSREISFKICVETLLGYGDS